jgi:stage IV sporulation protein FB
MKIEINLKIILLMILFLLLNKIELYMLFIVFIIIHELAHMIVGMILGFKPKKIGINPLGVSIEFYNYDLCTKLIRWKRIITYFAGPLINFSLCVIFNYMNIGNLIKEKMIYTNLLIGIFNLIPILPLDGGRILNELLKLFYDTKVSNIFMLKITKAILIIITVGYSIAIFEMKNIMIFLVIIYLWYLYYIEERKIRLVLRAYETINKQNI